MYRRTLAISAALVLSVLSTQADAARKLITFNGVCNVAAVTTQPAFPNLWAYWESTNKESCSDSIGVGTLGTATLNGIKSKWISFGLSSSSPDMQGTLVVQYPLVSGGKWMFYETTDGRAVFFLSDGTYTVGSGVTAKTGAPDFWHAK